MENENSTIKSQSLEAESNVTVSATVLASVAALSKPIETEYLDDLRKRAGGKQERLEKKVKVFVARYKIDPTPLPGDPRKPGTPYLNAIAKMIPCSRLGLAKNAKCMKMINDLAAEVKLTPAVRPPRKVREPVLPRLEKWKVEIREGKNRVPRSYIDPSLPDFAAIERRIGLGQGVLNNPKMPYRQAILDFVAEVGLEEIDVSKASGPVTMDEVEAAAVRECELKMGRQNKTQKQINAEAANLRWAAGKVRSFMTDTEVATVAAIEQALEHFQADDTQRKLVSAIKRLKEAFEICELVGNLPPTFDQALYAIIVRVGVPNATIARSVGLKPMVLRGWADGTSYPGPTTRFAVAKLEDFFQLPAGALADRCPLRQRPQSPRKIGEKDEAVPEVTEANADDSDETDRKPEFAFQPEVRSLPILPEDADHSSRWPRQLRRECDAFLTFRTDPNPPYGINRSPDWSVWSFGTVGIREPELGRFFGFLASQYNQLCRLTEGELSFVLFLFPELLHHFLDHRKIRRAKKIGRLRITNNDFALLLVARNLVHPDYGWLTQQPKMAAKLRPVKREGSDEWLISPDDCDLAQQDWKAFCQLVYKRYDDLCATTKREVDVENEHAAIRAILELRDPLVAFDLGAAGLKEELAYLDKNSWAYHLAVRDAVMWLIQAQCALRRKNIAGLELDDLSLRDGVWHLHLDNRKMKNRRSSFFRHDRKVYDLDIDLLDHDGLYDLLVEWRNVSRPLLLKGRISKSFFIGKDGSDLDEPGVVQAVQRVYGVYILWNAETRTGIEGTQMTSIHWMRGVLCTGMLKQTGSFGIAADAIADSVETVTKHYARYLPADRSRTVRNVLQNRKDSLSE
ncbi:hypothetical protein [uncultured Rhodoblastus sp.]|uniref:hypothetical protein n=1 Tax=uncultured Rhodoblastus sp. TaxID=543037 RepID=UPI0025F02E5B|nr:hypothetical protein [uncultured Rhodoblastus sp.]